MLILGIDLEGINDNLVEKNVDLSTDRVMEIGAVLWNSEFCCPVNLYSELIDEDDRLKIDKNLEELTGLNETIISKWGLKGQKIKDALLRLVALVDEADYLMAHNVSYDKLMLEGLFQRCDQQLPQKTWIDSSIHIEFPDKIRGRSMAALEHAHGFINPFPHRAVTDALSMLKIASKYDLTRMIDLAKSPRITIIANFKAPNWNNKSEVQEFNKIKNRVSRARFRWNAENKTWSKDVFDVHLKEGLIKFDFDWYIQKERP